MRHGVKALAKMNGLTPVEEALPFTPGWYTLQGDILVGDFRLFGETVKTDMGQLTGLTMNYGHRNRYLRYSCWSFAVPEICLPDPGTPRQMRGSCGASAVAYDVSRDRIYSTTNVRNIAPPQNKGIEGRVIVPRFSASKNLSVTQPFTWEGGDSLHIAWLVPNIRQIELTTVEAL